MEYEILVNKTDNARMVMELRNSKADRVVNDSVMDTLVGLINLDTARLYRDLLYGKFKP